MLNTCALIVTLLIAAFAAAAPAQPKKTFDRKQFAIAHQKFVLTRADPARARGSQRSHAMMTEGSDVLDALLAGVNIVELERSTSFRGTSTTNRKHFVVLVAGPRRFSCLKNRDLASQLASYNFLTQASETRKPPKWRLE